MGVDDETIFNAVAQRLKSDETENANSSSHDTILYSLSSIPSLRNWISSEPPGFEPRWKPPVDSNITPEQMFRSVLSSAHFNEAGNVSFSIPQAEVI